MSSEIFTLGPLVIRWYGALFALAFLLGLKIEKWIFKTEGVDQLVLDSILVYMIIGTTVGARLGHCLFYEPGVYITDPIRIFKIWEGGLASHGGVIGILVALYFAANKYNLNYLWLLDRISIPSALGAGFIRLGNLFNSEIIGHPTDVAWAVTFARVDNLPRHPTQVYEAICYFMIFGVLLLAYRNHKFRNAPGFLTGIAFFLIFISRFIIEFFKENQVAFEKHLPLDMGQLLSIPVIIAGIILIFASFHRKKGHNVNL